MIFDTHILLVLLIVLAFILLDWACGILRAVATGTFKPSALPAQLETFVLPLFLPLLGLALVAFLAPVANIAGATGGSDATFYAAAAAVVIRALADIVGKLASFSAPASVAAPLSAAPGGIPPAA